MVNTRKKDYPVSHCGESGNLVSFVEELYARQCRLRQEGHVWNNVVVLNKLFNYLGTVELKTCRRVCSLWSDEVVKVLTKKTKLEVCVPPAERRWDYLSLCRDIRRCRTVNLYEHSTFCVNKCTSTLASVGCRIIQSLKIGITDISILCDVFRSCPDLKDLTLTITSTKVQVRSFTTASIRSYSSMIHRHRLVDDKDYREDEQEAVVMRNLESLNLTYNVQWRFGEFFSEIAPNLTRFKCKDQSGAYLYSRLELRRSSFHFTDQLARMNTSKMQYLDFSRDQNDQDYEPLAGRVLDMDFSSLKRVNFDILNFGGSRTQYEGASEEFYQFLDKVSPTLEQFSLDIPGEFVMYENEMSWAVPMFPNVTEVRIPHCAVTCSTFFGKFPSLRKLDLLCECNSVYSTHLVKRYKKDYMSRFSLEAMGRQQCGFFEGNIAMWRKGGDWSPHYALEELKLEILSIYKIPDTLASLFPSLKKLVVSVAFSESGQLRDMLRFMRHLETLSIFEVWPCVSSVMIENLNLTLTTVDSAIFWVLLHGLVLNAPTNLNEQPLLSTALTLRHMIHLRKFTLYIMDPARFDLTDKFLSESCFRHMPNLVEHHIIPIILTKR